MSTLGQNDLLTQTTTTDSDWPSGMPSVYFGEEGKAHILVVDDEPEIAQSLAEYLIKKEAYTVSVVEDGRQAIELLRASVSENKPIDLVLLDMRMPGMSGLEVLTWIRKHPALRYMRVVLLTVASGSHEKVQALSAGADDYITKPYYPRELLARVQTILRTQQLEKQLQRQSRQLAELNRVGQMMAATLETSEVLATAVEGVDAILGVEQAAILMLEGGKLRYRQLLFGNEMIEGTACPPISVDQGLTGAVFTDQKPVFLNHPGEDERFQPAVDVPPQVQIRSVMMAPLIMRERTVGVVTAYNKGEGPFNDVDLDIFASLASSISEAIENAWLFQRNRMRQQELLENRNTLQALIDGIPHPIYTVNDEWELVSINKSKLDELEVVPDQLVHQKCYSALFQRQSPCEHCAVARTLSSKTAQQWTVNWSGPDHLPQEWEVNAYPIPSAQTNSARAVIVWQDRTEERRLESSLLQAGKLAAIGRLAAGVAHEINNPLAVVTANAQLLKMIIPPTEDNYESIELIERAGERAAQVVGGLLDFARQEQYMFAETDVNDTLQQAMMLVEYQLQDANIEVIKKLAEDLPLVMASREHLKSVWLNLLVNARDAVQERKRGRQIAITTRAPVDGKHVLILIHDNGKGISQAEAEHIFEPFYTTKDPGKGTGLGLATCHRIIGQHGGEISVASTPGKGTTFIVRLPVDWRPDNHTIQPDERSSTDFR